MSRVVASCTKNPAEAAEVSPFPPGARPVYVGGDAAEQGIRRGRRPPDRLRASGRRAAARAPARLCRRQPGDVASPARRAVGRVHGRGLGRARRRPVVGSARVVLARRLRGPARRLRGRARPRAAARGGAVPRRRARARALPPPSRGAANAGPRLGVRRLGRLTLPRGDRAAPAPGAGPRGPAAGGVRGRGAPDDVRARGAAGDSRRLRGERGRVPPGRDPRAVTRVRRGGPARRPAPDRRADAPALWRSGRARPGGRRRGAARGDPRVEARGPARHRPPDQPRGARPVQRGGARLPALLSRPRARSRRPG